MIPSVRFIDSEGLHQSQIIRVNAVIIKEGEEGEEASPDVQART